MEVNPGMSGSQAAWGGGVALPFIGQAAAFGYASAAASKAHDRQKNMITRMPAYLRAAGINPLYAYGGGGAKAPNVPMATAPGSNARTGDSLVGLQKRVLESQAEKNDMDAFRAHTDAERIHQDGRLRKEQRLATQLANRMMAMDLKVRSARSAAEASDVGQALLKYGTYSDMAGAMMSNSAKAGANVLRLRGMAK